MTREDERDGRVDGDRGVPIETGSGHDSVGIPNRDTDTLPRLRPLDPAAAAAAVANGEGETGDGMLSSASSWDASASAFSSSSAAATSASASNSAVVFILATREASSSARRALSASTRSNI